MKALRSLLAELSSNWLRRRKAQASNTAGNAKATPSVAPQASNQRAAHRPKPPSTRDVASNM
ncbi:hypothetical protein [Mesorhizobium sp. M7A.F.Ca.CA.004.05.2.1]|uniref:hypothetical protein n=1 Tax=Mesorhizobium sp. M7A.F.Ca.CA.004.05.2.1 TaxID=2496716 RepID=UPI0019D25B80|nr:hypothetical protein [Mesorhizobium sp. M7A.F.Ca.CA.004.05.2.1]